VLLSRLLLQWQSESLWWWRLVLKLASPFGLLWRSRLPLQLTLLSPSATADQGSRLASLSALPPGWPAVDRESSSVSRWQWA
jgi:hypothetical protein